jgi:hypothetical protein
MANTYTWVISQLECYPQHEGKTDVVFTVHWRRQATDGSGHNADIYGSQAITLNPDETFVPYANLTQAEVIGWLEAAMGADTLAAQEAALDKQIADQVTPPVTHPPLPWVDA